MNICLFGDSLTALTLAKALINKNFKVFMHYEESRKLSIQNRTIGISSDNLDFLQKKIIKVKGIKKEINPILWKKKSDKILP